MKIIKTVFLKIESSNNLIFRQQQSKSRKWAVKIEREIANKLF